MDNPIESVTTPRMMGERLRESNYDDVLLLHRDPDVMRTLSPDGDVLSEEQTRQSLTRHSRHWDEHGFGLWLFYERETCEFIGRGGLMRYEIDTGEEIGLAYAIVSSRWNRGFASEMTEIALRTGFETLGFDSIASWTLPTNETSQRVMQKFGFEFERDFEFGGLAHRLFRLNRELWEANPGGKHGSA